jgi:hypothetical protein
MCVLGQLLPVKAEADDHSLAQLLLGPRRTFEGRSLDTAR